MHDAEDKLQCLTLPFSFSLPERIERMIMDKYLLFTSIGLAGSVLIIVGMLFFYCRRIEHRCNRSIAKCLREQDYLARELERTRVEKSTLEKLLRMKLSEVVELLLTEAKTVKGNAPSGVSAPDMDNMEIRTTL